MNVFTDQVGREVVLPNFPPKRIISLVPSQTELLFDLGLEQEIVGITKFCIHPEAWFRHKTRVGGTKQVKLDEIHKLQPDLIIGNKEENTKEAVDMLAQDYPVWLSEIYTLSDALDMIRQVGELTYTSVKAEQMASHIHTSFQDFPEAPTGLRVAYFIWNRPLMAVGSHTFIHDQLIRIGFRNAFGHLHRYPEVTEAMVKEAKPDLVFLSSEPFPFKEKHINEFEHRFPNILVQKVDGELFSWYGSRLIHAIPYYKQLIQQVASS